MVDSTRHNETLEDSINIRMKNITSKSVMTPNSTANLVYLNDIEVAPKPRSFSYHK